MESLVPWLSFCVTRREAENARREAELRQKQEAEKQRAAEAERQEMLKQQQENTMRAEAEVRLSVCPSHTGFLSLLQHI